jgi:hypothetical protein
MGTARRSPDKPGVTDEAKEAVKTQLVGLTNVLTTLDASLAEATANKPEARKAVLDREKTLGLLAANRAKQEPADDVTQEARQHRSSYGRNGVVQWARIALAILVVLAIGRGATSLRLFLAPASSRSPPTYLTVRT